MQKKYFDTLHHQGWAFTAGGMLPAQIKPTYNYSDVSNLLTIFEGSNFFSF